jgi:hypothetical protein
MTYEVKRCNFSSFQKRSAGVVDDLRFIAGNQEALLDNSPCDFLRFFLRDRSEEAGNGFL